MLGTREKWQAAARSEEDFSYCHSERSGELVREVDRESGFFAALRMTRRGLAENFCGNARRAWLIQASRYKT